MTMSDKDMVSRSQPRADAGTLPALAPLPCPFCGGDGVSVADATRILGVWNLIHRCPVVGAISLQEATREAVVKVWNTRSKPQEEAKTTSVEEISREDLHDIILTRMFEPLDKVDDGTDARIFAAADAIRAALQAKGAE